VVGLGLSLSGSSCGPKKVTAEYIVTLTGAGGPATASITYAAPYQSDAVSISLSSPWTFSFPATITEGVYTGTYVFLYAQNDSNAGELSVTILEDGRLFGQASTIGGFPAAVTVNGNF
jgi:hypothetical protein